MPKLVVVWHTTVVCVVGKAARGRRFDGDVDTGSEIRARGNGRDGDRLLCLGGKAKQPGNERKRHVRLRVGTRKGPPSSRACARFRSAGSSSGRDGSMGVYVCMTTWGPHIFPSGLPVRLRGTASGPRQESGCPTRNTQQQGKAPNRAMLLCLCCIPRRLPFVCLGTHPAPRGIFSRVLFTSLKISDFGSVAFSFVCDKYYLIMN